MPFDLENLKTVLSGERRDPSAMAMRATLTPLSWIYAAAVQLRNRRFDRNPQLSHRVDRPVISIGNITTGGTGKTPMVEWIARWFRQRDLRVAVISRGYGAEEGSRNDEAMELEQRLPDVPHLQNPDRVAAARVAIEELESEILLLDDAFQHRRIQRDLNLVLIDALNPFGFDHLLPRGLLREPLSGLGRADMVILTRADQAPDEQRQRIRETVAKRNSHAVWAECIHRPKTLLSPTGERLPLDTLEDASIGAFCGLGNPTGFLKTLSEISRCETPRLLFPDHHAYERADIDRLHEWAAENQFSHLVCTHKDLVKVGAPALGATKLLALLIEVEFTVGEAELSTQLASLITGPPSQG